MNQTLTNVVFFLAGVGVCLVPIIYKKIVDIRKNQLDKEDGVGTNLRDDSFSISPHLDVSKKYHNFQLKDKVTNNISNIGKKEELLGYTLSAKAETRVSPGTKTKNKFLHKAMKENLKIAFYIPSDASEEKYKNLIKCAIQEKAKELEKKEGDDKVVAYPGYEPYGDYYQILILRETENDDRKDKYKVLIVRENEIPEEDKFVLNGGKDRDGRLVIKLTGNISDFA